jgi:1,4-alpha-glucan branching enzyme
VATKYAIRKAPSDPASGMGANLLSDGAGVSFRVWAPNASAVQVLLRATDAEGYQSLDLAADPANGAYYSADVLGAGREHQYRFSIVNNHQGPDNPGGAVERIDPYARDVETSDANAPGFITDPAFAFVPFRPPYFEDYLIYQLHLGSFAGLGDGLADHITNRTATFRQIADNKLDHIRGMNFNAVEFLPTSQTPFKASEGYAPSNFFSPEVDYGDPEDLCYLVDQCHRRGLAVILDVVYNHVVDKDAFDRLLMFDGNTVNRNRGIYFSSLDNFGPVPDFDRTEVRDFFIDNARQCFREFHADGLRFDSAHAILGQLRGSSVMSDILAAVARDFPDKFLIAEHNNPSFAVNALRFGASWEMGSADRFIGVINSGSIAGAQALIGRGDMPHAFNLVRYLLGSHDQIFADYALDPASGTIGTDKPFNRYFVERAGGALVGRSDWTARAKARMGWALNVAMPCTPMLFMGTECHHYGYWNPNLDAFGEHRFNFALISDAIGPPMMQLVRDANQVRWNNPALRSDNLLFTHFDAQNQVLGFKRWNDQGNVVLAVLNMSDTQFDNATYGVSLGGDGGSWEEIFNSQAPQYGGFADSGNFLADLPVGADGQIRIRLPKWSVLLFRKR